MRLKLSSYWRALTETLGAAGLREKNLLAPLPFVLFAAQNASLIYYVSNAADSRPVIAGIDNDASNAIDVAGRSRWITDNGFAGYGPVYFRLANTLAWVLPDFKAPGDLEAA